MQWRCRRGVGGYLDHLLHPAQWSCCSTAQYRAECRHSSRSRHFSSSCSRVLSYTMVLVTACLLLRWLHSWLLSSPDSNQKLQQEQINSLKIKLRLSQTGHTATHTRHKK